MFTLPLFLYSIHKTSNKQPTAAIVTTRNAPIPPPCSAITEHCLELHLYRYSHVAISIQQNLEALRAS